MHTVKIYHYKDVQCKLSVTKNNFEFVAQVYEIGELIYSRFRKRGKDAAEVMRELEVAIDYAVNDDISSWHDLSMVL